ncbi:MAG: ATP-binding cassette domain-containing protein [Bdellovibrionota bacterium]
MSSKKYAALKVENLSKNFSKPVLESLSFEISSGQSVALVGANGAGKSTLLKCLMGLIFPNQGEILFFDSAMPGSLEAKAKVAFLPELVSFWPEMTPLEILALCVEDHTPREKLKETLSTVGLVDRSQSRVGEFSKGMTQRLGLACLLIRDPNFLILDEPMTGLDFRAQEWLRHFLLKWKQNEKTLLISTHSLRDVEILADHVLVLEKGKLAQSGSKEKILPELYKWREQLT